MAKRKNKRTKKPARAKRPTVQGVTRAQLAQEFAVTPGTITRWERDGMPVLKRSSRGRHTLFAVAAVRTWRATVHTQEERQATFSLSLSKAKESEKRTEKLDMEIAVKRGELIPRDLVVREGQAFGRAVQARIRSLPRRALHSGLIEAAQVAGLEALCRELLDEISRWKTFGDLQVPETKTA